MLTFSGNLPLLTYLKYIPTRLSSIREMNDRKFYVKQGQIVLTLFLHFFHIIFHVKYLRRMEIVWQKNDKKSKCLRKFQKSLKCSRRSIRVNLKNTEKRFPTEIVQKYNFYVKLFCNKNLDLLDIKYYKIFSSDKFHTKFWKKFCLKIVKRGKHAQFSKQTNKVQNNRAEFWHLSIIWRWRWKVTNWKKQGWTPRRVKICWSIYVIT